MGSRSTYALARLAEVRPNPRSVPVDVLRALLARLFAHDPGRSIGKPFQGLKTP